jgi:transposase
LSRRRRGSGRQPIGSRPTGATQRLARLLRLGEITPVRVPGPEEEAARDLVRAREDARGDLMQARHRLSKLLLRHGAVYDATAWTRAHDVWLRRRACAFFCVSVGG